MDRFQKYCTEGAADQCWLWKGPVDAEGYGWLKIDKKVYKAHRLAFEYFTGEAPKVICHRCPGKPNKLCVNPNHLHNGSKADNRKDQVRYGEDARLKINPSEIPRIRERWTQRTVGRLEFYNQVAQEYGVKPRTIEGICYGYDRQVQYEPIKK